MKTILALAVMAINVALYWGAARLIVEVLRDPFMNNAVLIMMVALIFVQATVNMELKK